MINISTDLSIKCCHQQTVWYLISQHPRYRWCKWGIGIALGLLDGPLILLVPHCEWVPLTHCYPLSRKDWIHLSVFLSILLWCRTEMFVLMCYRSRPSLVREPMMHCTTNMATKWIWYVKIEIPSSLICILPKFLLFNRFYQLYNSF